VIHEAERQIAFADRIIINKKDLVEEYEIEALKTRIKEVNCISPILVTEWSRVPLDEVLGIFAFDKQKALELDPHFQTCSSENEKDHEHNSHDSSVKTILLEEEGQISQNDFNNWIGELLWEENSGMNIYRCKGVVAIESEEKYVLQGVHSLFELEPSGIKWEPCENKVTKILFIGKGFSMKSLSHSFQQKCHPRKTLSLT